MNNKPFKTALLLLAMGMLASCGGTSSAEPSKSSDPSSQSSATSSSSVSSQPSQSSTSSTPSADKKVSSIEVSKLPDKVNYVVNEAFDPTGGEITATYDDQSTEVVAMTDSRVTITAPNTKTTGKKNVKVAFGGASKIFSIQVSKQSYSVVFNSNGGSDVATQDIEKGKTATEPATPSKDGSVFDGWYTDESLTLAYDFSSAIEGTITLYAKWLTAGAVVRNVVFDYGYYGSVPAQRTQHVEDGGKAVKVSVDPTRKGYRFDGWTLSGADYDFNASVTSDITLLAKWTLTNTGAQTYVFEAEDVNFKGIVGKGLSGTATETACIVNQEGVGASGDRYVSYLYQYGLGLKFDLTCDKDMSNVAFSARLSQFIEDYTYDKSKWEVCVNDVAIDYQPIVFTGVPPMVDSSAEPLPFADFSLGSINLVKGHNTITLTTVNSDAITGTTMVSHCPLIDCLKFGASDFVVDWDASLGYPYANY